MACVQLNLPINITTILGPCGVVCDYALCGLNVLCHTQAEPLLAKVNGERTLGTGGTICAPLRCADFIKGMSCKSVGSCARHIAYCASRVCVLAPESQCKDIVCNPAQNQHEPGYFSTTSNCVPPAKINTPQRTSTTDCCETCTNECQGVPCTTTLEQCGKDQQWPLCFDPVLTKADPYDCCPQCLNPCVAARAPCCLLNTRGAVASFSRSRTRPTLPAAKAICAEPRAPPAARKAKWSALAVLVSCAQLRRLLYETPFCTGDCCYKCVAPCSGVSCTGAPTKQEDCPACTRFVPRPDVQTACQDCCGRCEASECVAPTPTGRASSLMLALTAVLAAAVAML